MRFRFYHIMYKIIPLLRWRVSLNVPLCMKGCWPASGHLWITWWNFYSLICITFLIRKISGRQVDVKTGEVVTFDSYSEEAKYHDDKISINYAKGIEVEHVLASGTFPAFFDYPKFKVNDANSNQQLKNEEHACWDGGYKSNTPLREVIQAHIDYWQKKKNIRRTRQV